MKEACQQKSVFVSTETIQCPQPDERVWDAHPVIFLKIEKGETTACPYCNTLYERRQNT